MLISPFKMLNTSGSSSNDVLRKNLHTFVTLGSFSILGRTPSLVLASELISFLYKSSASFPQYPTLRWVYIVRNFKNVKSFQVVPTLLDL